MKKATSTDVAKLAGVSQTSVSLILNNNDKIAFSQETRDKVLAAAKELGYQPPKRKNKKITSLTGRILVLVPTLTNYYYTEVLQYIQVYLNQHGYQALICNSLRSKEIELSALKENIAQVDGILYTFLPSYPEFVDNISHTLPVVLIGEKRENLGICSIELSNSKSAGLIAEYLYSLGHRRFVFLSTPLNSYSLSREQRLQGICNTLQRVGLEDAVHVVSPDLGSSETESTSTGFSYEYETGYNLAMQVADHQCFGASAFICVNDMTALGAMDALAKRGLRIPDEISICGFDNIFPSAIVKPGLTTVDHQLKARCKYAVEIILTQLQGGSEELTIVNKVEYAPQLVVRGSTARV